MERWRISIFSIVLVSFVLWLSVSPVTATQQNLWGNQWTGPWIDKLVFKVIENETEQILALFNGDVDIIGNPIDLKLLPQLQDVEHVELSESLQMGYGEIVMNCGKYPMNITNFRRAFAYAVDKKKIVDEVWEGFAMPLDCNIPRQHPASIENEIAFHYYYPNILEGARLLEVSGFEDTDEDGWLEGPSPNGPGTIELDTIIIESPYDSEFDLCVDIAAQALTNLGIKAEVKQTSIKNISRRLKYHADYDMAFQITDWSDFRLDTYACDLQSKYINIPFSNKPNWSNSTWDMFAEIVLHSLDYDMILATIKDMAHLWVYSCPSIVLYQNMYFTAFRTDEFDGVIPSIYEGAPNYFTKLRIHSIQRKHTETVVGGTYTLAIPADISTFNHLKTESEYDFDILEMLFDSLVRRDANGNEILWMADSYKTFTHTDSSEVEDGHTRIYVHIIQNATWSDGTPITAEDFAFSLNFLREYVPFKGMDFNDIVACWAPRAYYFWCEFKSESYWHWSKISYKDMIPSQVWLDYAENYAEYQPRPSDVIDMVTSGPFRIDYWTWSPGESVELVQNPDYYRNPRRLDRPTTQTPEPSQNTTETSIDYTKGVVAGFIGATAIILVGSYIIFKTAPTKLPLKG